MPDKDPPSQDPRIARMLGEMNALNVKYEECVHWEVQHNLQTGAPMIVMIAPILPTGSNIINKEGRPYVTSFFSLEQFDEMVLSLIVAMNDLRKKFPRPTAPKEPGAD